MGGDDLFAQTVLSSLGGGVSAGELQEAPVLPREPVELREGAVLGSYQLEALLGEGSMGQVYQGRHVKLGRQVALKVLKPEHARDGGFVQRFFQEARTVNQINHEHIVEIFDFVDEGPGGHVYCVMELLRGRSLGDLAKEEPLTLSRIQRIGVQVCAALGAAHQVGVVHRDIKPDNLFITQRGGQDDFVKVLDFGVAKLLTAEVSTTGTMDGTIIGTPAYMAPEQAAGLPVDRRADIYAVGNILYEMVAGHPPFLASAFGQLVVQIITHAPPPLPALLPSGEPVPPALSELILRCLAKEPEDRPQHLAEVTTSLLLASSVAIVPVAPVALATSGGALAPVEPPESERPTLRIPVPFVTRRARLAMIGGASALLVAVAALVVFGTGTRSAPQAPVASAPAAVAPLAEAPVATPAQPVAGPPVVLTVNSFPPGAEVMRADTKELLGVTPLVKEMPRMTGPVELKLTLAGYVPVTRMVGLDQHAELEVPLIKARTAPQSASKGVARPAPVKKGAKAPGSTTQRSETVHRFSP